MEYSLKYFRKFNNAPPKAAISDLIIETNGEA